MNSFLSHFFTLLSLILLPCREISPLLSYLFLQSFLTLICLLISPLFFSSDLSPSLLGYHHLIVTSSRHHTITSAQARSHAVTSPLLKLTITQSPHICSNVKWAGYKWVARVQIDMVRNGQIHIES